MAEREVRLTFRVQDDGTIGLIDQAGKKVRTLGEEAEGAGRTGFSRFQAALVTANQALQLFQTTVAAVSRAVRFFTDAAAEQEKATALMNATLRASDQYTAAYSARLHQLASSLQLVTRFGDEAILNVERQLIAYGATEQNVGALTLKVLNLSEAFGRDLSAATLAVGAALQGNFSPIARQLKIQLDENIQGAKGWALIMTELERKFGGAAAAAVQTFGGRLEQIQIAFGDIAEEVAATITQSDAMLAIMVEIRDGALRVATAVREWVEANRGLIDERIRSFFDALPGQLTTAAAAASSLASALGNVSRVLGEIAGLVTRHPAIAGALAGGAVGARWGVPGAVVGATWGAAGGLRLAGEPVPGLDTARTVREWLTANRGLIMRDLVDLLPGQTAGIWAVLERRIEEGFKPLPSPQVVAPEFRPLPAHERAPAAAPARPEELPGAAVPLAVIPPRPEAAQAAAKEAAKRQLEERKAGEEFVNQTIAIRLAIYDAESSRLKQMIQFRQRDLELAEERKRPDAERLAIAAEIDRAETQILQLQREGLTLALQQITFRIRTGQAGAEEVGQAAKLSAELANVNAQIARGPEAVQRLTAELERAAEVTINVGELLESSLTRATDALLTRTGKGDLVQAIRASAEVAQSALVGAFIKAQVAKAGFHREMEANFGIDLPGIVKSGAGAIVSIWGRAMDALGIRSAEAYGTIASGAAETASVVGGALRNIPGIGSLAEVQALFGGGGTRAQMLTAAEAGALGAMTTEQGGLMTAAPPPGTEAASAAAGAREAAGASGAGLMRTLGQAALAFTGAQIVGSLIGLKPAEIQGGAFGAAAGAALGSVIPGIGTVLGAIAGSVLGAVFGDLFSSTVTKEHKRLEELGQAFGEAAIPTFGVRMEDTVLGRSYLELFRRSMPGFDVAGDVRREVSRIFPGFAALPRATQQEMMGRARALPPGAALPPAIAALMAGAPGIERLRGGAFAVGLAGFRDVRLAETLSGAFPALMRLGQVSEDFARQQLLKLADAAGVDLPKSLDLLNHSLLNSSITQEQFTRGVEGAVELFTDELPPGVDAATVALEAYEQANNKTIINVKSFNEELQRQIDLFGALQKGVQTGLRGGISAFLAAQQPIGPLVSQALAVPGVDIADIIRAQQAPARAFRDALFEQARQAVVEGITTGAFDAIKELPAWRAFEEAVANAVKNGSADAFGILAQAGADVFTAALPILDAAARQAKLAAEQFAVTPTALLGSQADIERYIAETRFGLLRPRQQVAELQARDIAVEAAKAALERGGITAEEAPAYRELLEEQTRQAQQLVALGQQIGGRRGRRLIEQGLGILGGTAADYGLLVGYQDPTTRAQTLLTQALTTANVTIEHLIAEVKRNTEALSAVKPVPGEPSADAAIQFAIERVFAGGASVAEVVAAVRSSRITAPTPVPVGLPPGWALTPGGGFAPSFPVAPATSPFAPLSRGVGAATLPSRSGRDDQLAEAINRLTGALEQDRANVTVTSNVTVDGEGKDSRAIAMEATQLILRALDRRAVRSKLRRIVAGRE